MKKHLIGMAALLLLTGCTVNENKARAIVQSQGYTNVTLGGPSIFGCSEDDNLTRTFKATSATGQRVEGSVCAGLFFKGATVRIDSVSI